MIRRGKADGWLHLRSTSLVSWSSLYNIQFDGVTVNVVATAQEKGLALLTTSSHLEAQRPLVSVPRDLVLCKDAVEVHAKTDVHLREILLAVGDLGQTARGSILIFLLLQATRSDPNIPEHIGVAHPFADYMKFLPLELLPTLWTASERALVAGTSLASATAAKLRSLEKEFTILKEQTQNIVWCSEYWWNQEHGALEFDDWKQVDAMYRSRALEFPGIGDSMVPCIDMANHASGELTRARYDISQEGDALLLLRDDVRMNNGDEMTITYGDEKGACEMMFSYGFIENDMEDARAIFLELDIPDDDPLGRAKRAVATCAPGVKLSKLTDGIHWESDYVWLICVNEEDGFRIAITQMTDGRQQLEVQFEEHLLHDTACLRECLQTHSLWEVFQLRAVSIIQDRIASQLRILYEVDGKTKDSKHDEGSTTRYRQQQLALRLRVLEIRLLEQAYESLQQQKMQLIETGCVQAYLQSNAED